MTLLSTLVLGFSLAASFAAAQPPSVDYVVVGAGTAGCAAAARLIEQGRSVLLVERGGSPADLPAMLDKYALRNAFNQWERNEATYRYQSEANQLGVRYDILTGKGLGGTTAINANLYSRPAYTEFDAWGVPGWSGEDVKSYFKKIENFPTPDENHGNSGPLFIRHATEQTNAANFSSLLSGLGFVEVMDGNAGTVTPRTFFKTFVIQNPLRQRLDSFDAYLTAHLQGGSPLLTLMPHTQVVGFETRDGETDKEVVAVNLLIEGTRKLQVLVSREVIISAGVFETPKLLNLAGIGNAPDLLEMNIPLVMHLPAVGQNLLARPLFLLGFTGTQLFPEQDLQRQADPIEQQKFATGQESFFSYPISGIWGAGSDITGSLDFALEYSITSPSYLVPIPTAQSVACLGVNVQSRGSVKLRSTNPADPPRVTTGILDNNADIAGLQICAETIRAGAQTPFGQSVLGQEFLPGAHITGTALSETIKATSRFSYHAYGTAKMGTDPATSVVSPRLLVHGFANLRVADGSVIPGSLSSGPMSTVYVIGERVADFIMEDNRPPYDFSQGFDICMVGGEFLIVKDEVPPSQAKDVCAVFLRYPLKVTDPNLTCASKRAVEAINECGVASATVRRSGLNCNALADSGTLLENIDCNAPRPVLCAL